MGNQSRCTAFLVAAVYDRRKEPSLTTTKGIGAGSAMLQIPALIERRYRSRTRRQRAQNSASFRSILSTACDELMAQR